MTIDERLRESAPRVRAAVDGFTLPEPAAVHRRRSGRRVAALVGFAAVIALALTLFVLRPGTSLRPPATVPSPKQWYAVDATVLQRPGGPPELCVGGVLQSRPPQCSGAEIVGWNWATAAGSETAAGVRWGEYRVVGRYDDSAFTFTLTRPPGPAVTAHVDVPAEKFAAPCATPPGGWTVRDPSKLTLGAYQAMTSSVPAEPGYAGMWLDDTTPVGGRIQPFPNQVITFAFTGNIAERRADIERIWGGPICVVRHARSRAQLDAIVHELVSGSLARDLGLRMAGAVGTDDVANALTPLDVMLARPGAQRELDRRFGPGVVELHQVLIPVVPREQETASR